MKGQNVHKSVDKKSQDNWDPQRKCVVNNEAWRNQRDEMKKLHLRCTADSLLYFVISLRYIFFCILVSQKLK